MTPKTSWVTPTPKTPVESVTAAEARERLKRVRAELEERLLRKHDLVKALATALKKKQVELEVSEANARKAKEEADAKLRMLEATVTRLAESATAAQLSLEKLRGKFGSTATVIDNYARAFAKLQKASQLALQNGDNRRKLQDKRKELRDKLLDTLSKTMELKAKE